ncbi:helix-turn-helix transcriptional regulator, partial [Nostoc sp. CHAB 5834]|nr:helix-turn-helix transcriptional regulator [Nostoc sp. CHAB 5834]
SQEQLAEIAGLSSRTVQRVEEGQPSSVDTRRALASAFGAEDIDLFNKPYVIPTAEQMAEEKARFENEHLTLRANRIETGKQLGTLAEGTSASLYSEMKPLPHGADTVFARLTDYCREFAECAKLYSAVDKSRVYEELDGFVSELKILGYSLVGATREAVARASGGGAGVPLTILYVVACPAGEEPEHLAVSRNERMDW